MKYCERCKTEVDDVNLFCPKCGFAVKGTVDTPNTQNSESSKNSSNGLRTAAKVFMVIGTVLTPIVMFFSSILSFPEMKMLLWNLIFALLPLAWCIPMTVHYFHQGDYVGVKFKILTLLFVNTIAGILMLCDNNYQYKKF
ncbi:MAG: hypothetical protein OSJ68_06010 [Clostridia bacterium]|nr:hypothetical protein [Clostridia bacterium]